MPVSDFLLEVGEFATFSAREQRYIRRALEIAYQYTDKNLIKFWSRDNTERQVVEAQIRAYEDLDYIKSNLPQTSNVSEASVFIGLVLPIAVFDLCQEYINRFSSFRFLYERLIGVEVRPFLPAIYVCASAVPHLPNHRRVHLLQNISEKEALDTSKFHKPVQFFPEWIDKDL